MPSKKPHKYYRMNLNGTKVWACGGCSRANCHHYMPAHMEQLVINRTSICWNCGEEFMLDALMMQLDKPICGECNPMTQSLLDAVLKLEKA